MISKPKVLFLSSWSIGEKGKGDVSFVYDQIESIACDVEGYFIEFTFLNYFNWIWNWLTNQIVVENKRLWDNKVIKSYNFFLPKLSTRLTRRSMLQEIELASIHFSRMLIKTIGKPDVIHIHTILPSGLIVLDLAEKYKIPLIIHEHSGPFSMHTNTLEKKIAVKKILGIANIIFSVSNFLKLKIVEEFPEYENKIQVLPNLVRTDIFKPILTDKKVENNIYKLISVINLQPIKGFDLLLKTLKVLKDQSFNFIIEIIGIDSGNKIIRDKIDKLQLSDKVLLLGKLTKEEIAQRYIKSDIYICTSEEETFGLAPAEAIATGVPVAMTDCGGPTEFMNLKLGLIGKENDPNKLAKMIIELASKLDSFDISYMFRSINKYNANEYKSNLKKYYQKIINRIN